MNFYFSVNLHIVKLQSYLIKCIPIFSLILYALKKNLQKILQRTQILRVRCQLAFFGDLLQDSPKSAERLSSKTLEECNHDRVFHHPILGTCFLGSARFYLKQQRLSNCEEMTKKDLDVCVRIFEPSDANIEPVVKIFEQLVRFCKEIYIADRAFISYMEFFLDWAYPIIHSLSHLLVMNSVRGFINL